MAFPLTFSDDHMKKGGQAHGRRDVTGAEMTHFD